GKDATRVEDAKATYAEGTVLIYHFSGGMPPRDASGRGNNALSCGAATDGALIGPGLRLDGRTPVSVPAAPRFIPAAPPFSWSALVRMPALQRNDIIYSVRDSGRIFTIGLDNGVPFVESGAQNSPQRSAAGAPFPANNWKHLTAVASGGRIALYVDGVLYAS